MDNSVFISYRRDASEYLARAIYQDLHTHGIDVFMDIENINGERFDEQIANQIAARPCFVLLLTPGTLERCNNPSDGLRQQIEHAVALKRAFLLVATKNLAIKKIDEYLQLMTPPNFAQFLAVGVAYHQIEKLTDALRTRLSSLTHLPAVTVAEPILTTMYDRLATLPRITREHLEAQEYFERAMVRTDQDSRGKITDYTEAIRLNPNHIDALQNRGAIFIETGELDRAIADFNEAIRLNPQYARPYFNRGTAFDFKGELDRAILDFNEAIRLNPHYAIAFNNRASVFEKIGQADRAIADRNEAIRLDPHYGSAYFNRGNALARKGELDKAIEDYTATVRLNSHFALAFYSRAVIFGMKGELERAIADYTEAIRLQPDHAAFYNNRGATLFQLGELDKAIADFNIVIRLEPKNADAYSIRGLAKHFKGNFDGAIEDYNQALAFSPNHPFAPANLELARRKQLPPN